MNTDYDILIVGAGMVGASLACALRGQPLRIGVIEAVPFRAKHQPSYDDRTIALSYGSRHIFAGMGLWGRIGSQATPIKQIHVSEQGRPGFLRMDSVEQDVEALGYVIENRRMGELFTETLNSGNIELLCPARVTGLNIETEQATVLAEREHGGALRLTSRLLVVADGRNSAARELLGISSSEHDYRQTALITNITPERHHNHVAYERFTPLGPLALLPMSEGRCAVVWSLNNEYFDEVTALTDAAFLDLLQAHFGERLGRLQKTGERHAYPLVLSRAHELVRPRVALLGNAACTHHPIAAQSFNLGLRDVAAFSELLMNAKRAGRDLGDYQVLQDYARSRRADHLAVTALTDVPARLYSSAAAPLSAVRSLGVLLTGLMPPLKQALMRRSMGIAGWQSRLARGLAL
ncbi:MAG: 2-octaprenyl-6-methoxyphenyl hydroxylase [Gammaproteobacteria bacterium]